MTFREKFSGQLKDLLEKNNDILAAWEGGSAATGYLDEYSDLDLGLICTDNYIETCFELIEIFLEGNYGIKHRFRVPEPSWHGHSQCYYFLDKTPPLFFFDLLIEKESAGNRFLESDRHGKAVIWFDPHNLIDTSPTPPEETKARIKAVLTKFKDSFPVLITDLRKLIKRGKIVDSFYVYHQLINRMGMLFNIKYRPAKYDFGLRYTSRDYPEKEVKILENFMIVRDLTEMSDKVDKIENRCAELWAEIEDLYLKEEQ